MVAAEDVPPFANSAVDGYAVIGSEGQVLRRGYDLAAVLRVLEKVRPVE